MWLFFFLWLSIWYLSLFAALDWSNLTTNVSTGNTLSADLWNNSMTNIKNNADTLNNSIDSANSSISTINSSIGAINTNMWKYWTVVTVWWTANAPTWSTLLYSGLWFWSHYTHNWWWKVCIKWWDAWPDGSATYWDLLYPMATWAATYLPTGVTADKQVKCSVVHVPSTTFEMFWSQTCPTNWTVLYKWYAMSSYYGHANKWDSSFCVDTFNFDASLGYTWTNGTYLVWSKIWWSSDTANYPLYKFVKCAVCYKN